MGTVGKEKEAVSKKDAAEKANMRVQSIKTDYESLTIQFLAEFSRFKVQKSCDIHNVIVNFATIEAEFNQKSELFWSSVLPNLQSVELPSVRVEFQPSLNGSTTAVKGIDIITPSKAVKNADL